MGSVKCNLAVVTLALSPGKLGKGPGHTCKTFRLCSPSSLNIHKRLPKYLTNKDKDTYLVHSLLKKKGVTMTPKGNISLV